MMNALWSEADPHFEPVHEDPMCRPCSPNSPIPETPAEDTTSEPTKPGHAEEARGPASCLCVEAELVRQVHTLCAECAAGCSLRASSAGRSGRNATGGA